MAARTMATTTATARDDDDDLAGNHPSQPTCVVIGKIIIDEYKHETSTNTQSLTIGGGGPQAAWGAAAALAILSTRDGVPASQPVTFIAPVGKWTDAEQEALEHAVGSAVSSIHLIRNDALRTPKIALWHGENQSIQWKPLDGSWGEEGADALWRDRPSSQDVLGILRNNSGGIDVDDIDVDNDDVDDVDDDSADERLLANSLFIIMEGGANGAAGGMDSLLLSDPALMGRIAFTGVEPIVFPDETTGKIRQEDFLCCQQRIRRHGNAIDLITPDEFLYEAIAASDNDGGDDTANEIDLDTKHSKVSSPFWNDYAVAARYGPHGSILATPSASASPLLSSEATGANVNTSNTNTNSNTNDTSQLSTNNLEATRTETKIPAATLTTKDGQPVNPTGAGNAYSSAITAALGAGASYVDAACIASAIGAVVCEHEHLPPWTSATFERIREARDEIAATMKRNELAVAPLS